MNTVFDLKTLRTYGLRPVRRVALLGVLALSASGCLGWSSGQGAPLTSSQAIAKAKADGFTEVLAMSDRASWRCIPNFVRYGPMQATGRYKGYLKPLFQLATNDPTVHTPGIGGPIFIVLPTAADAARCVSSLIGELEHPPLSASKRPYKVIDPATIVVAPHPVNSPTSTDPKATGDYQIFLSRGRVLALGETDTQPDAATVESDMAKLASQISGS